MCRSVKEIQLNCGAFVVLRVKKLMLNIRFLCLLGGTAALMQKGINNNFKLCLIRKLLYLFMSNLSLAFPWRVGNTVSMIPCHYWLLFLSENILSEISKEKELSAKLEAASTGAGCLPAAFVTIMSSAVKISVIFICLRPFLLYISLQLEPILKLGCHLSSFLFKSLL